MEDLLEWDQDTWISEISVDGLHNRLSFRIFLNAGMNIIYGKNGLGKTTLLHIIANLTELDIGRFRYLSFRTITVVNNLGRCVSLHKDDTGVSVTIDGNKSSYTDGAALSEVDRSLIRKIVGERATYLPAFRSVLERMRESGYASYEERSRPEFEALRKAEIDALRSVREGDRLPRRESHIVDTNISKTLRCRQWFGEFVPAIRYPSLTDVINGLSDEWTNAQIAISKIEQKQFETAFVEIFSAIAQGSTATDAKDQSTLLEEIKNLLPPEEDHAIGPNLVSTYLQLVNISQSSEGKDKNYSSILEIYRNKLKDRKTERERVFSPTNAFQESVNVFLAEKSLKIGSRGAEVVPRTRATVFIQPAVGKSYGVTALSSGERQILTMLYSTSRSPFRSGCCLIDEPELSLHIDWQRIILEQIAQQHQGRQIIACTHSPEVGADHGDCVQFFTPQALDVGGELDIDDGGEL